MRRPAPLPPTIRGGAFSTRTALEAGVAPARLARRDLTAPFHGVRLPVDADTTDLRVRCSAYSRVMSAEHCFSHATAAELYGIVLPRRMRESMSVHVAALNGGRAPRGAGVIGHSLLLEPHRLRAIAGLPLPRVAEVWCQLSNELTVDELVVAGDSCLRRRDPLAKREDLVAAARSAEGRRGAKKLRSAIVMVRAGTDSPKESELRVAIVRAGLPEPLINHELLTAGGIVFHGDLVYPDRRLVIEYDGEHHWTDPRQRSADTDRLWMIEQAGWRFLHFSARHLANGAAVAVARTKAALRE